MRGQLWGYVMAVILALATPVWAEGVPASSPLGIDYLAAADGDAQLAQILLAGEAEWLQHATKPSYRAKEYWGALAEQVQAEEVTKRSLGQLMTYAPKMVLSFEALPKEKYPLLQALGELAKVNAELARSNAELARSNAELAQSDEILAKARALAAASGGSN